MPRAILSVSDKRGVVEFARDSPAGVELVSTGGTVRARTRARCHAGGRVTGHPGSWRGGSRRCTPRSTPLAPRPGGPGGARGAGLRADRTGRGQPYPFQRRCGGRRSWRRWNRSTSAARRCSGGGEEPCARPRGRGSDDFQGPRCSGRARSTRVADRTARKVFGGGGVRRGDRGALGEAPEAARSRRAGTAAVGEAAREEVAGSGAGETFPEELTRLMKVRAATARTRPGRGVLR